MPSSPTKSQRSVLFKVTVPSRIENIYQTSEKNKQFTTEQQEPGGVRSSKRCITKTTKEADNSGDNAMYHELRKSDLRYKIQSKHRSDRTTQAVETICEFGNMKSEIKAAPNVLESLRNSSHGRVPYNRKHVLSEEELPPVNQLSSVNKKAIDRVCDQSPDINAYRPKNRGRVPLRSPKKTEEIIETATYLDQSFETNLNKSLAVIESLESLNDSMSLLEIEQKNKKAGVDYIEREKKKQDEFFKRSAQLSQESYEQWSERSRAKIQQQVKELRARKSQKDNSIESEYRKQQEFFQKKFEEDQANIKRVEVEEAAENQRQLSSSWNNISNYELSTLEIVTVAQKCVPDPKVDPEIEALLSMIDKQSKAMSALKSAVGQLYKDGKLNPLTSTKFEQECGAVYGHVINAVKQLNTAIKRVNEDQAAKMLAQEEAKKKEEEERGKQEAAAQQPPPEAVVAQQPLAAQQPLPPPVATKPQPSAGPVQSKVSTDSIISGNIISSTAFSEYQKIDKQLKELELGIQKFVVDKNTDCAKMRSALKLITVTPINSISASSNDHMANKVKELVHILDGKETTRGQKRINPGINNLTLNYCFNVAASKFVDQACEQVAFSDNLVPAFSIAAVITGIWQKHALFGDLFLGHLYKRCPYTLPAYWNKKSGESNEDYLRRVGYSNDGDKLEETDKYLLKMEGCVKLYAAIIQGPPTFSNMPHPHGVSNGWLWLSRMLNLEPMPDITATALEAFLKVAGSAMLRVYKSQFLKLLEFLYTHYLPKIEAVTLESNLGPITRLRLYLEKIQKTGTVPEPEGRVPQSICS